MKFNYILLFVFSLLLNFSCVSQHNKKGDRLANTVWRFCKLENPTENQHLTLRQDSGICYLILKDDNFDLRACNGDGGSVKFNDTQISFESKVAHTKRGCMIEDMMVVENFWYTNSTKINRYKIAEDSLYLFGENNIKMEFVRDSIKVKKPVNIEDEIFLSVEEMPVFPGGDYAFSHFIKSNLQIPAEVSEASERVTVYVTFIIDKQGYVTNVEVLRSPQNCAACEAEAIRVIKLSPQWKPGSTSGKVVRVRFNYPIRFY